MLNNDAIAEPTWIKELVSGMERSPDIYFAASKILKAADQGKIDSAGDGFNLGLMSGYSIGNSEDEEKFKDERLCFSATGGGAIYRKELFDRIGLFDEKFFAYFEDIDLGFRAQYKNFHCKFLPKAVIYHEGGLTSIHYSRFHLKQTDRNKILVLLKNMPLKYFWRYKKPTLKVLVWPKEQIRNHGFSRVDAVLNRLIILFWLPIILFQRYKILSSKKISDTDLEKILV